MSAAPRSGIGTAQPVVRMDELHPPNLQIGTNRPTLQSRQHELRVYDGREAQRCALFYIAHTAMTRPLGRSALDIAQRCVKGGRQSIGVTGTFAPQADGGIRRALPCAEIADGQLHRMEVLKSLAVQN